VENIVLVGSSGHAKVVIDVVEKQGRYQIAGLLDRFRQPGEQTLGYSVLGGESDLPALIAQYELQGCLIAIGDNAVRGKVAALVSALCPSLPFVTALHPAALIGKQAAIGAGTVVMGGAVLNPDCSVGQHCIVNTNAVLEHDSLLDDYASLAPAATTGGHCRIGKYTAVGIGATLKHGIVLGEHTVVGAGATVLRDIEAYQVAFGTPARPIRRRAQGDKYL